LEESFFVVDSICFCFNSFAEYFQSRNNYWEIKEHITFFASDDLEGRDSGTEELFAAAVYISDEFKNNGFGTNIPGKFYQEFPFIKTIELTDKNSLSLSIKENEVKPNLREDYITVPFQVILKLMLNWFLRDLEFQQRILNTMTMMGLMLKIKLLSFFEIHLNQCPSFWIDAHSPLRKKASVARDKGAAAIIFVNPYDENKTSDDLVEFSYDRGGQIGGFSAMSIKRSFIEQLFQSEGNNFKEVTIKSSKQKNHLLLN